jgi:predicted DCC family thiol-disulfide oxidoreductase YuxK
MQTTLPNAAPELTLYYDGQCPLCVAEVEFLQSRSTQDQLAFVDVTESNFEAASHNISCAAAMASACFALNSATAAGDPPPAS